MTIEENLNKITCFLHIHTKVIFLRMGPETLRQMFNFRTFCEP